MDEWRIAGTYLESCNCKAICPCRMVDGIKGNRSTYGLCLGALSWQIEDGHADDVPLSGLAVALASRYHDDEPGSPWTFALYLDERADDAQRDALTAIFTGAGGGDALKHFPWAWKDANLVAVRPARIEIDHAPRRQWFRAGEDITVRIAGPVGGEATVRCVIPGYGRPGEELFAETLSVRAEAPLDFEFTGNCAYASTFDYRSAS